jgi:hypothetical protein
MKAAIILAMLPVGIASSLLQRPEPAPVLSPQPVQVDTFKQRFEGSYPVHTFKERWWPGEGLPFDQRWAPVREIQPTVVRTITITKPPPAPAQEVVAAEPEPEPIPLPPRRPALRGKPRPTRVADICQRHGMHRVDYGRTWRCRK